MSERDLGWLDARVEANRSREYVCVRVCVSSGNNVAQCALFSLAVWVVIVELFRAACVHGVAVEV